MGWFGFRPLVPLHQAAIDFLIADRCLLCKQVRPDRSVDSGGEARFADSLAGGQKFRLFKLIRLVNHSVCPTCSHGFEDTRGPGVLASIAVDGAVVLPDGSRFEALISGQEDRLPPAARVKLQPQEIPVIAPFMINDPVLELVHLLKFSGYRSLARLLARAMVAAVKRFDRAGDHPAVLVPVPMARRKKRQRGFNQAELIARELSRQLGLWLDTRVLRRVRQGEQQSKTQRWQRASNVRGAFTVDPALAAGRSFNLVDDLVTSGSTAAACAAAALEAGAREVKVICFGRAQ